MQYLYPKVIPTIWPKIVPHGYSLSLGNFTLLVRRSGVLSFLCSPSVAKLVKLVESGWCEPLPAEDLGLHPVRCYGANLIVHVLACWNSKDVVELCGSDELAKPPCWTHSLSFSNIRPGRDELDLPSRDLCLVSGSHRKIMTNASAFIAA